MNPFATNQASSPFNSPFANLNTANAAESAPTTEPNISPVAETATEVAVAVVNAETGEVATEVKVKKPRKPRAPSNRRKSPDEVKYILANYKHQSTSEIARHLQLTPQQVSRTVLDTRKSYLEKAETLPPEKAAKVRAWIEEHLPSKAHEFGRGGGKRGSLIENLFDDIFADL